MIGMGEDTDLTGEAEEVEAAVALEETSLDFLVDAGGLLRGGGTVRKAATV